MQNRIWPKALLLETALLIDIACDICREIRKVAQTGQCQSGQTLNLANRRQVCYLMQNYALSLRAQVDMASATHGQSTPACITASNVKVWTLLEGRSQRIQ